MQGKGAKTGDASGLQCECDTSLPDIASRLRERYLLSNPARPYPHRNNSALDVGPSSPSNRRLRSLLGGGSGGGGAASTPHSPSGTAAGTGAASRQEVAVGRSGSLLAKSRSGGSGADAGGSGGGAGGGGGTLQPSVSGRRPSGLITQIVSLASASMRRAGEASGMVRVKSRDMPPAALAAGGSSSLNAAPIVTTSLGSVPAPATPSASVCGDATPSSSLAAAAGPGSAPGGSGGGVAVELSSFASGPAAVGAGDGGAGAYREYAGGKPSPLRHMSLRVDPPPGGEGRGGVEGAGLAAEGGSEAGAGEGSAGRRAVVDAGSVVVMVKDGAEGGQQQEQQQQQQQPGQLEMAAVAGPTNA